MLTYDNGHVTQTSTSCGYMDQPPYNSSQGLLEHRILTCKPTPVFNKNFGRLQETIIILKIN